MLFSPPARSVPSPACGRKRSVLFSPPARSVPSRGEGQGEGSRPHRCLTFIRRLRAAYPAPASQRPVRSGRRDRSPVPLPPDPSHNVHALQAANQLSGFIAGQAANHWRTGAGAWAGSRQSISNVRYTGKSPTVRFTSARMSSTLRSLTCAASSTLKPGSYRTQYGYQSAPNAADRSALPAAQCRTWCRGQKSGRWVSIGMRIEVHQRHLAEVFGVRAQRQRDIVITAKSQHAFAICQQLFRVRLQLVGQIL